MATSGTVPYASSVHVLNFAADESFVHFHRATVSATQLGEGLSLHRKPNAMQHEPRRFLCDAKSAVEFIAGNAVLRVIEQPERRAPLIETDRRILEHGPDLEREFLFLVIAIAAILVRLCHPSQLGCAAMRAFGCAIGPANEKHELPAVLAVCKVLNRLL